MQNTSGAFVIARMLAAAGVSHLYGIPGGAISPVSEAINLHPDLTEVLAKHEEGAAFMAQGHVQVAGGLGVVFTTTGPGATNALTGVANAYADQVPMLILTANTATDRIGRGAFQDSSGGNWSVDVVDVYRSVTKLSIMLPCASQLPRLMAYAILTALSNRPGPVHLSLPGDVLLAPVPEAEEQRWTASLRTRPTVATPAKEPVTELAEVLCNARHPVVLAGLGARTAHAQDELVRLAELLNAPVATTLNGKGVFPEDHPLSLGVFGTFGGHPTAHAALLEPDVDLVLAVGCAFGEKSTLGWTAGFLESATLCQIDSDPTAIGRGFPVAHSIVGDARMTVAALNQVLSAQEPRQSRSPRFSGRTDATAHQLQHGTRELRPSTVVARLSERMSGNSNVFGDIGDCMNWIGRHYACRSGTHMFMSLSFASMGYAYAAAVGGAFGAPGTRVIAIGGDAAFAMNGMEIHTAVEHDLPVTWVVLNNGGHAALRRYGLAKTATYRHPLQIASIAAGLGCPAAQVTTLDELDKAIGAALQTSGPYLIDACVTADAVPPAGSHLKHG
ncbi:thiamine pyrophosphate-binding protein [Streptomyces sp. NPDC005529]|uniref:thiamine pyrophosphate-binding protein n=1 Tax=unclassified Streptomyces TaxID=2593676 RepID=UPI0033BA869D